YVFAHYAYLAPVQQGARGNLLIIPERQTLWASGERALQVKYTGNLDAIAPAIRTAVRMAEARLPIFYMRTLEAQLGDITGPMLMIPTLLSLFAARALALAGMGRS